MLKRFFLNLKGLSDASAVSLTNREYGSEVHFLYILMKSLELMSDEALLKLSFIRNFHNEKVGRI